MKSSFWQRWYDFHRNAKRKDRASRARPRRQPLHLEPLEDRMMLSLAPQMVLDINTNFWSSNPSQMVAIGSGTYFTADDGMHGVELWKSDGTAAGTDLVKDIYPGGFTGDYGYYGNSSSLSNLTNVNGTLFFTAEDGTRGYGLWKSDGTAAGTMLVSSLGWGIHNLTNVNGTLLFTAGDSFYGSDGVELWKSDGTTAGTTLVKDIYPGTHVEYDYGYYGPVSRLVPNSSSPSSLTNVSGMLFFTAYDDTNGRELWKSDGTAAGTVLVKDIRLGTSGAYPSSSNPSALTNSGGTLFFTANDGSNGSELWRSDGTAVGTMLVKDIRPGASSSYPYFLTNANGTLFFTASDGTTGSELWRSDGTAAGTVLVKDIQPGSGGSWPRYATNAGGKLFFRAYNATTGYELWKSDGTAAGTVLVKDVQPGIASSYAGNLTNVNGTLFFTAYDDSGTSKLWKSDGTAAGTVLAANLFYPSALTNSGGTLFFAADDGVHGTELWALHEDGLSSLTINDVTLTEGHTGTRFATFTVALSAASNRPVTVAYATAAGTATAGNDYGASSGTLTFAPGETEKTITVQVNGDRLGEPNETFFVNLSNPSNATIADGKGQGTIVDDEPRISISDVTKNEGKKGQTTLFTFVITLSAAYDQSVTMSYRTLDSTARTSDNDYVAKTGTLTFAPGETTKTITIEVKGDSKKEADETFYLDLFGPSGNGLFTKNRGLGTILNDD